MIPPLPPGPSFGGLPGFAGRPFVGFFGALGRGALRAAAGCFLATASANATFLPCCSATPSSSASVPGTSCGCFRQLEEEAGEGWRCSCRRPPEKTRLWGEDEAVGRRWPG
jgi:hypothetical protein